MKLRMFWFAVALVAAVVPLAMAQDTPKEKVDPYSINLEKFEFKGGSLDDFAVAANKAYGSDFAFVVSDERVKKAQIAPFVEAGGYDDGQLRVVVGNVEWALREWVLQNHRFGIEFNKYGKDYVVRTRALNVEEVNELRLNLEFAGGTMNEFVKHLTAQIGSPAPVFVTEDAMDFRIPPVRLANVTLPYVMNMLNGLSVKDTILSVSNDTLYKVTSVKREKRLIGPGITEESEPATITAVYPVGRYLADGAGGAGYKVEDIVTAIETALNLDAADGKTGATIKFHQETKLLIVKALPSQQNLVTQVMLALESELRANANKAKPAGEDKPK
jgi:hypothetical protein